MQQIEEYGKRVGREFNPHRVVLFGSYACGTPTPDSDVDILVIMPHSEGKGFRMATKIRGRVPAPFPMDLLVRTPDQIRERRELGDCFIQEITAQGKVLYEFPGE